jgi:hypothetical protein
LKEYSLDNSIETAAKDPRKGQLARIVLNYSLIMKRLVDEARQPGFTVADWALRHLDIYLKGELWRAAE